MSLINKMLKDLETRDRAANSKATVQAPYQDLRPISETRESSSRKPVLLSVLLLTGLAAGGFYFFGSRAPKQATTAVATVSVAKPVAVTEQRVAPATSPTAVETKAPLDSPRNAEVAVAAAPVQVSAPPAAKQDKPAAPAPIVAEAIPTPAPKVVAKPAPRPAPVPVAKPAAAPTPEATAQTSTSGKTVMEKLDRPVSAKEQAEARYREAAQFLAQGRTEDGRATLYAALASYPGHHKARELAVALAMQNGRLQEAQDLLTQGRKLAPEHIPFAQLLARVFIEQGAEGQAITTLEGARSAAVGNADYLSFLAAMYQRAGRHTEAAKTYRETIAARAQDARAWLGLGISLEATQDVTGATEAYIRAIQLGTLDARLGQYAQQRLASIKK